MKSLFGRYLIVTVSLLLFSFLLSGTLFMWRSYTMSVENTKEQLELKTKNIASMTISLLYNDTPVVREMYLNSVTQIFDEGSNVIICNSDGILLYYADVDGIREGALEFVDSSIMDELKATGSYYQVGDLGGALSGIYYTSGILFRRPDAQTTFALFVSSPASGPFDAVKDTQRTFFLYAAFILFMAIIVSYYVAQSMSRPIKKMIVVTRSYSRGDFSPKVTEDRDDEIGELAHAINQMSSSLNKLEELRSSFIANVSHELKTPMTTITGFVDGILDGTIPPERQDEYLRRISADTKRLSRLVIRMLQASRIESGQTQIHPARFDLCETIRQTILGFEQVLLEKNIDVQIDFEQEDMFVMADPDNLVQVVFNLTDNACKFTPPGGTLAISVVRDGSKVVTTIANTGSIPEDKLPYLFDRFYKADTSRAVDANGAGLGLFIVKSILKMHGESIVARSENGLAKFIFTLPAVE
ncbi:MAG: HAMP domain-containing sensor histidine kinase [Clostridiaceae bacterium]|nr:HAMP domain-containing sensor histidine kinase [Clostridiaceae bacterium]